MYVWPLYYMVSHLESTGTVIAALITLYDHACTLDAEVKYIWNKSWNSSKILFVVGIYMLSSNAIPLSLFNSVAVSHVELYLFYTSVKIGYIGMLGLLLAHKYPDHSILAIIKELHGTYLCMMMNSIDELHVKPFWVTVIVFESILLFFTLWKSMSDFRHAPTMRRFSLSRLIIRDSVIHCTITSAIYSITNVVWTIKPIFKLRPRPHSTIYMYMYSKRSPWTSQPPASRPLVISTLITIYDHGKFETDSNQRAAAQWDAEMKPSRKGAKTTPADEMSGEESQCGRRPVSYRIPGPITTSPHWPNRIPNGLGNPPSAPLSLLNNVLDGMYNASLDIARITRKMLE
ncbi:hypothetical protein BDQ17DRAFT_1410320 [Cyathus striatus]|nr:hypothetical protein BDQ17DRAFT_1410320 [Cyathus striatus]